MFKRNEIKKNIRMKYCMKKDILIDFIKYSLCRGCNQSFAEDWNDWCATDCLSYIHTETVEPMEEMVKKYLRKKKLKRILE